MKKLFIAIEISLIVIGVTLICLGAFIRYLNSFDYFILFGYVVLVINLIYLIIILILKRFEKLLGVLIISLTALYLVISAVPMFFFSAEKKMNINVRFKYGSPALLLERSNPSKNEVGVDSLPESKEANYDIDALLYNKILDIKFTETFSNTIPLTKNCTSYVTYVTGRGDLTCLYLKDNGEAIVNISFDLSPTRLYYFKFDKKIYPEIYLLATSIVNE